MTDIILKIYSTNAAFGDTLDHTIFGDLVDYEIVDNSNYQLDSAWFRINDGHHRWESAITASDGSVLQLWRAFSRSGVLISSGLVVNVRRDGNYLILEGCGMSNLMQNFTVLDKTFTARNLYYILTNTTYGLLQGSTNGYIPAATYGTFDLSMFVDKSLTTEYNDLSVQDLTFDGDNLYNKIVELSRKSYGTNSKPFDFYLFEQSTRTGTDDSGVANKTTYLVDTSAVGGFNNVPIGAFVYNTTANKSGYGYVTSISTTTNPNDTLNFTTLVGGAGNDFDNGDTYKVETFNGSTFGIFLYLREREVTPARATLTTSDILSPKMELSIGESAETYYNRVRVRGRKFVTNFVPIDKDWWTEQANNGAYQSMWTSYGTTDLPIRNTTGEKVGSSNVMLTMNNGDISVSLYLGLNDSDAYSATSTPYGLTQGSGYVVDTSVEQWVEFWLRLNASCIANMDWAVFRMSTEDDDDLVALGSPQQDTTNGLRNLIADTWQNFKFRISDTNLKQSDYIKNVAIQVGISTPAAGTETIEVDGLHFWENAQTAGVATDGTPTYIKEYLHNDPSIETDKQCSDFAGYMLNALKRTNYCGDIELQGNKRRFHLKAGDNVELIVPSKGVNIKAGQTQTKINIETVRHTPNKQTLSLGRRRDMNEIINDVIRMSRSSYNMTDRL